MSIEQQIEQCLILAFSPNFLEVKNQSHLHAGHAGDDGSGESHFKIKIKSNVFEKQSRVARERMVYKALDDIMPKIHALSIFFIENS